MDFLVFPDLVWVIHKKMAIIIKKIKTRNRLEACFLISAEVVFKYIRNFA